jgi:hypothetical protein
VVYPRKQSPAPPVRPPVPAPPTVKKSGGWGPFVVFGGIIVGALALGQCSTTKPNSVTAQNNVAQNAISSAITAQSAQGMQIVTP